MKIKTMEFQIGIRPHNGSFLYKDVNLISKFIFIKNPLGYWLADPFVIRVSEKHYLFAEAATKLKWKGKLVYAEINPFRPNKLKWKVCMKEKNHLSFPNVFLIEDTLFMLPETSEGNFLSVYKNIGDLSSLKWKKEKSYIIGKKLVDSIFIDNYIVTYNISNTDYCLELYSKGAAQLIDSICDSDYKLRPAGRFIETEDELIFVSQNCLREYGEGLIFNSFSIVDNQMIINKKFEINYVDLNKVFGKKNYVGIHTYNFDDKYEVIDVRKENFSFLGVIRKIINKIDYFFSKKQKK